MVTLSWCDGCLRVKVIGLLLQSLQHISVKPHHDAADGRRGKGGGGLHALQLLGGRKQFEVTANVRLAQ